MKKGFMSLMISFCIVTLLNSCATVDQVSAIERRTNDLSNKFEGFDKKFADILAENNLLKFKLQDRIPLATSKIGGLQFEAMVIKRDGTDLTIEVLITNKNEKDLEIHIDNDNVAVVDEFGNQYEVNELKIGKGDYFTRIFTDSPVKMIIKVADVKTSAKLLTVLGFGKIAVYGASDLTTSLKNLPIN